ncbi:type I-B CRISPR-associated endonuclease Cas1b [Neolewinella litorea]|uniref:CRISPR-associated endonuclease Cas1 n=1 Tax=Neolewinella litorea TaxID=2562452 RepID=A0A4S4N723_9BACT|nr:type I-B CRISPR-associated endonuclease Cas1b [Neolewinella litorea]THH34944.1 type I-B CRISPR-associated endonuclease Cas1 [Neolewinella litorea]
MKRSYYIFNPGRLSRRDDTLKLTPIDSAGDASGAARYLPVETVESLYVFGSLDANSAAMNFLGKKHVPVHFFDYYEHYTGSFQPKDYLLAGKMQIEQTRAYLTKKKRLHLARMFVAASAHNLLRNLRYYANRGHDTRAQIDLIEEYRTGIEGVTAVDELMGVEGNCRQTYYDSWDAFLRDGWRMGGRSRRPPGNEVNALVSFGNSLCYAACLDQLYHTQLNPTISFLHEPGFRRYSLALDLAEIFKPVLVDRLIFRMLNKLELQTKHFEYVGGGCFLKETGRKLYVRAWDERLGQTIKVKGLSKPVSYKRLIRLEAYKIQKFILGIDAAYKAYKAY